MKNELQAVFIDRDGTMGGDTSVTYPGDFTLFPFTENAIKLLKEKGILIFAFTNQPGISEGKATENDFIQELSAFGIDKSYICPHLPEHNCKCRKPEPGMLLKAADEYGLELKNCIVIGDRWSDMLAAERVGAGKILVKTGSGIDALGKYRNKWVEVKPNYVAKDILDAVDWILDIDSEQIPSYLKSMLDSRLLKANQLQNATTLNFLFFNDPHIVDTSSFSDIYSLNYINSHMVIDFAACCGDNLDNTSTKQLHLDTATKLMNKITIEKFFTVKGNHDDNSFVSEGIDNIKYTMLPYEQYDIMFKKLEGIVNFDVSNKCCLYYYYDNPKFKVRTIFLNSIDIPYIPDSATPTAWRYAGQSTYSYSDAQLNWLTHTALKLPSNEWKVIFFTHVNPFDEGMIGSDSLAHNSSVLLGIVDAFKSGKDYTSAPSLGDFSQSVSVDFSLQGRGKVIAFFYGHTHTEQVLDRNGIKYISTWNDCPRKSPSNPDAPTRMVGTISEFCLNVVTVNFEQNKIYMTKFGAGNDLVIDTKF